MGTYGLTLDNPGNDYKELELVAHGIVAQSTIGLSYGFRFAHQPDLTAYWEQGNTCTSNSHLLTILNIT